MRISKPPEERRQEMIDTAMKLFSSKGYEATTMTDIAKEMNVVSGLCYRYFRSKEDLYHSALKQYAGDCAAPMIRVMNQEFDSVEEYIGKLQEVFQQSDGREKYHDFFHGKGNEIFHKQLEGVMLEQIQPHMISMIETMSKKGIIKVEDCRHTALFILYGEMPIINDDSLSTKEKISIASSIIRKIIGID